MKKLIKQLLREGLILTENKLYGKNVIDATTNRIGDKSDDTLNKLAIAGLYKNIFGDVQQLKSKEELDKVFQLWYDKTIKELIKTPSFIDNKELATKYLDAYIKNIKSLKDKAQPFSMNKVEVGLVDVVNNNKWIEDTSIKQGNDIYNPKPEDRVYQDENIVILDTNTRAKCVMYGKGESWCITKPELNYYNTYRIKYGATPYFVLQKNIEGPEHKLVIMHYPNGYAIADRTNSGSRSGGNQYTNGPWSDVEKEIPNLKGLEKYFPYRKITDDEIKYSKIIEKTKGYEGNNLQGYIDHVIKGLVINGSQVEADDFIRDYASEGNKITDEQLKSLRPEVVDSLIESGYFLTYLGLEQVELLPKKQKVRVIRLKIQNKKPINFDELSMLPKEEWFNAFESLFYVHMAEFLDNYDGDIDKLIATNPDKIDKFLKFTTEDNYWELLFKLKNMKNPQKLIKILDNNNKEYLSNLTEKELDELLMDGKNPSEVFKFLGKRGEEYVNSLKDEKIVRFLIFNRNTENVIEALGKRGEEYINSLKDVTLTTILNYNLNPEVLIKKLGKRGEEYISNLEYNGIEYLLSHSRNIESIFNIINKTKAFEEYLRYFTINDLITVLSFQNNPKKAFSLLGEKAKELLKELTPDDIKRILINSDNPETVINLIGDNAKGLLKELTPDDIKEILRQNKIEDVKEILRKYGHDV